MILIMADFISLLLHTYLNFRSINVFSEMDLRFWFLLSTYIKVKFSNDLKNLVLDYLVTPCLDDE